MTSRLPGGGEPAFRQVIACLPVSSLRVELDDSEVFQGEPEPEALPEGKSVPGMVFVRDNPSCFS